MQFIAHVVIEQNVKFDEMIGFSFLFANVS